MQVLRHTFSICPVCHKRIKAEQVLVNGHIYLQKQCVEHGAFSTVVWKQKRDIEQWRKNLPPIAPGENESCPHDCGLCGEHLRDTCCVLLEVTDCCNLHCAYCFAMNEAQTKEHPAKEYLLRQISALTRPGETLLQLSGGEPTTRDDLTELIYAAKQAGCAHVQLNTNGIRLSEDASYVKALAEAGLSFVFLQFDSLRDDIYKALRGRPLFEEKRRAIAHCDDYNIGVTLVPTLIPGVNINEIGDILRFAVAHSPAVRGVHFQPVCNMGRIPAAPKDEERFTLDELLYELEAQCKDILDIEAIRPSCCDHPLCGFHGDFMVIGNQRLQPLSTGADASCDCVNGSAKKNRAFVSRRWERDAAKECECACQAVDEPQTLAGFMQQVKTYGFTVTAMAFQDIWSLDLERLRQCSLHVYHEGEHIPFCAYYSGLAL